VRILFIYPHNLGHGDIPIGLTVLSAVLKRGGHEVRVFDCSIYANEEYVKTKKELYGMVRRSPKPPVKMPQQRNLSDLRCDLSKAVSSFQPDLLGVTVTTATYPLGLLCSRIAKSVNPGIKAVFGGVHPTLCPDEVISDNGVDIICIGEGEEALLELCDTLDRKEPINAVRNLWIKDPDNHRQIIRNDLRPFLDMNSLPVQDFQDFSEYSLYRPFDGRIYRMLHTELSRGCVFDCSYCANHALRENLKSCGRYHRLKDPETAVRHLKELKNKYGFNFIRFWDEDFTGHTVNYLKTFAELFRREVNLPFLIYADTRSISEEKVKCLKEMGCVTMAIGIESGSYWIRKNILNRNITNDEIVRKFAIARESGIRISSYNMIGLPFETREMVFETVSLNRQVNVETSTVGPFKPFPGTRLTEMADEFGMIQRKPDFLSLESEICTPHLSDKEIDGLVRTFNYYVKLPEKWFPILEACEKDEKIAELILPDLIL